MRGSKRFGSLFAVLAIVACFGMTGCQVNTGGQTLPAPSYLTDDVQYFPNGPEFKLANEAAAMQAAKQEQAAQKTEMQ